MYIHNLYSPLPCGRRHIKFGTNLSKTFKILEFDDYIWDLHEKCIKISTNMPGIGIVICEICLEMSESLGKKGTCLHGESHRRLPSVEAIHLMMRGR